MRDIFNSHKILFLVPPAVYSANPIPIVVDLQGFNAACIEFLVGAGGITFDATNRIEFAGSHSDDGVTYANLAVDDVQGPTIVTNGIINSLVAAHIVPSVSKVGYIGNKRFLKVQPNFFGTRAAGTLFSVVALLGAPSYAPAT
jgi:hypothetical protein